MSVRRESSLILYCDTPDCLNHGTFVGATASDARIKAIRARWRVGRDKATCGACQDKHVTATGKRSGDGFSARKIPRRDATYADEVEISGPGFDSERRNIASGVYFAAKRLAIAWLDAKAQVAS